MPILGGLLVSLFGSLAAFFAEIMAKKVAISLAYVTTLGTVTVALLGMLALIVVPISNALFSTLPFIGWMGLAFPQPATSICIAALGSVWSGTVLYRWQVESLRIAASV